MSQKNRTIFIGDVHGCVNELKELTHKLIINKNDRVILLGDLIGKGYYSIETLIFVYQNCFESIVGNHDQKYKENFSTHPYYYSIYKNIPHEVHTWYMNIPNYIEEENFIAVHAGIAPGYSLSDMPLEIMHTIRTWDGKGDNLQNVKNKPWHEFYKFKKKIFYGHWAKQGLCIKKTTYGLDSGCVYGGLLSAYILEENKLVQVKAYKQYLSY